MSQRIGTKALERWDDEGGSQWLSLALSFAIDEIEESERRILAFLGASIFSLWAEFPADARQRILNREAALAAFDGSALKARIARIARGAHPSEKKHDSQA